MTYDFDGELVGVGALDMFFSIDFAGACGDCERRFWHFDATPSGAVCGDGVTEGIAAVR